MKRARNKKNKKAEIYDIQKFQRHDDEIISVPEDTEADDFEIPENPSTIYDTLPDNEIPFSEGIFDLEADLNVEDAIKNAEEDEDTDKIQDVQEVEEVKETEDAEEVEEVPDTIPQETEIQKPVHSEEYIRRKAMNRKKMEQQRKRRRTTTIVLSLVILLFVGIFAALGLDFTGAGLGDGFISPVDTSTGKLNILLLGVDKEGERSDSIMLVSYDFDDHSINLLSIPRDTKMYVTDRSVTRKITEVHGMHNSSGKMYGAAAVAESVTALTGMPVNYYLEFSFDALDNIMDILGPVEFDVPDLEGKGRGMNYDDPYQDLHIHLKPGLQKLSGNQIQQFLRYRKSNYGTSDGSDISRVGRQQALLKAIIDQKVNLGLIVKVPSIFKEIKSQLKTNFTVKDITKYAGQLKHISSENMTTFVLPGESKKTGGAWYFICDFSKTAELITNTFGYTVTADELSNEINLTGKKPAGKANTSKNNSDTKDNTSDKTENKTEEDDKKETQDNSSKTETSDNTKTDTTDNAIKEDNSDKSDTKKEEDDKKTEEKKEDEPKSSEEDEVISLD